MWLGIIRTVARRAVLGTVVASVAVAGLLAPAQAGAPTAPFDHAGDDVGEAIAAADQETCDGVPTHEIGAGPGQRRRIAARRAGRSPSAASSSATFRASAASTCRTPTVTATPPPPTASSCSAPRRVDLGNTVAVTGTSPSSAARPQITARPTSTSAPTAPRPTCPTAAAAGPAGRRRRPRARSRACSSRPVDALTVSEVFDLTRFGELTLSEGGLLVQPTELARPGHARGRRPSLRTTPRAGSCSTTAARPASRRRTRPYLSPDHAGPRRRRAHLHRAARARLRLRPVAAAAGRRHR